MKTQISQTTTRKTVLAVLGRLAVLQLLVLLQVFSQQGSAQTGIRRPAAVAAKPGTPSSARSNTPGKLQPVYPILGSQDDCFQGSGGCMHTDVNITRNADGSGHLNA